MAALKDLDEAIENARAKTLTVMAESHPAAARRIMTGRRPADYDRPPPARSKPSPTLLISPEQRAMDHVIQLC